MCWQECASLSGILDKSCMVKGEQKGTNELGYLRLKRILVLDVLAPFQRGLEAMKP